MMRKIVTGSFFALCLAISGTATATEVVPAAASSAPAFSSATTDIGTLLDNAETKAILEKHLPGFVGNPQIDMARALTLKQIQSFAADAVTDEVLAKIDAELAKLPPKK